jgi:hypothetical protein
MNAFVIVHFGNNIKYLELAIFFLINLKKCTKNDMVWLYSINDTPEIFVEIIKHYCNHVIPYDDKYITYDINYSSFYKHFNLLRVCNFIFAYKLIQYMKICVIETDMIIMDNIDDIFNLNMPCILIHKPNILENYKIDKKIENYEKYYVNGGIMLFKPSLNKYKVYLKQLEKIIENKNEYQYPNESLFLLGNDYIYNLPFKYNGTQYNFNDIVKKYNINLEKYLLIIHFNGSVYKHIDIIKKNNYTFLLKKNKVLLYILLKYKKKYYDIYATSVKKIMNALIKD